MLENLMYSGAYSASGPELDNREMSATLIRSRRCDAGSFAFATGAVSIFIKVRNISGRRIAADAVSIFT